MRKIVETKYQSFINTGVKLLMNRKINKLAKNNKHRHNLPPIGYKKSIEGYWSKELNNPISDKWHRVYSSLNGLYDVKYIPEDLFYCEIEPLLNRIDLVSAYSDKNSYTKMLKSANEPSILLRNINKLFYNQNYDLLSTDHAEKIITAYTGELVVKPSIESGGGKNVQIVEVKNRHVYIGDRETSFSELVKQYGHDFLVQEMVSQNPAFNKIYPLSLNTIRVISLRWNNEIHILSTVVRFGDGGARVDNQASGGVSCGVNNGYLKDYAIDKKGNKHYEHPTTKEQFKGVKIEKYDSLIEHVKNLHNQLLYFDMVSWDIASDENCDSVFIELNLKNQEINFHQFNNGALFGELTEEICKKII